MIMDGYPPPNPSIFYPQVVVWNAIQARNVEGGWATDPTGLRLTLGDLNPPPGGSWNEFSDTNRDPILQSTLSWMAKNSYPVATLVDSGGHWVTIVGYETDVDPRIATATLDEITYNDPEPHNVGTQTTLSGAAWLAGPWNGAIIYGTIWKGKWVSIIEPPTEPGTVRVASMTWGERVISPEAAVEAALGHIKERALAKRPAYAVLGARSFTPFREPYMVLGDPRPVPEPIKGRLKLPRRALRVYLVPFGFEHERETQDARLTRIGMLVNGYDGSFVGITAFGRPTRLMTEEEAVYVALRAWTQRPTTRRRPTARLVFRPSGQTHLISYPFWEVTLGTETLFVDQLGEVSSYIIPSVPGD